MIDAAINQLASALNQYLKLTFAIAEDIVVVSNILEQDGVMAPDINDKVLMFLVNIQKDSEAYHSFPGAPGQARMVTGHAPVHLNLHVMIAANFGGKSYPDALKFISHVIGFFQRRPVFDHHNTPDLAPGLEKLALDIESLGINDLSNLWSIISGKYMPSVLYKIRMITIDTGDIKEQVHTIREPRSSVT